MSKLPVTSGSVALNTEPIETTDTFKDGILITQDAEVRATDSGTSVYRDGLPFTSTGQLRYVDATAGLPGDVKWVNGFPLSGDALCVSTDSGVGYRNGIPFAANYAVSAIFSAAGAAIPVLKASRITGAVPLGVHFTAVETTHTDPNIKPFHDLLYIFKFGDGAAAEFYSYGMLAGQRSDKHMGGPVVVHVYTTVGNYTPELYVHDGVSLYGPVNVSKWGAADTVTGTGVITAQDPDVVWPTTSTICVSSSGDFTGAPAGSLQITSSDATTNLNNYGLSNKRLLFKGFEDFTVSGQGAKLRVVNCMISSFGGGKANLIAGIDNVTAFGVAANASLPANNPDNITITNLNCDNSAGYDQFKWFSLTTVTQTSGDAGLKDYRNGNFCLHDVTFSDGNTALTARGYGVVGSKINMQKTANGTGVSGAIGFYGVGLNIACIDSRIDCEHGGEHDIRTHAENLSIVSCHTMRPANGKHHLTVRGIGSTLAVNTPTMNYHNVEYNIFDGTLDTISILQPTTCSPTNTSTFEDLRYIRWDSNYYKGIKATEVMKISARDYSFRNNLIEIAAGSPGVNVLMHNGPGNASLTTPLANHYAYGNTVRSESTNILRFMSINEDAGLPGTAPTNVNHEANIVYSPSSSAASYISPSTVAAPATNLFNSTDAEITGLNPLFAGAVGTHVNAKLQAGSPYLNRVISKHSRIVDAAQMLLGNLPQDPGALTNVGRQNSAWDLVP